MSKKKPPSSKHAGVPPPGSKDRRSICRYSVVIDDAWLGWWEGPTFQNTPAKIIDISLRGALVTVQRFPPKDRTIWLCPPGITSSDDWIEVKPVGMRKKLFGPREVRMVFRRLFPYEVFKTVVYGRDVVQARRTPRLVARGRRRTRLVVKPADRSFPSESARLSPIPGPAFLLPFLARPAARPSCPLSCRGVENAQPDDV